MYKKLFRNAITSTIIADKGMIIDCNNKALEDLGYPARDPLLLLPLARISADGNLPDATWTHDTSDHFHPWQIRRADGETITVYASFSQTETDGHTYLCIQWHQKATMEKYDAKSIFHGAILRAVLDADKNLIYSKNYCDGDGIYIGCNRAFKDFFGLSDADVMGRNDLEIFGEAQGMEFRKRDAEVIDERRDSLFEEWVVRPNGEQALLHTHKTILKDHDGHIIGLLSISRDITDERKHVAELEESEKTYKEMAHTDPLTGIPNRRLFFELSRKHFEQTHELRQPLSLIMIDVDDFKEINDTHGHLVGDKVLRHIVQLFKKRLRKEDLLARYAGDEFSILLPNTHAQEGEKIAQMLQKIVQKTPYITPNGVEIPVSISAGVSEHVDEDVCEALLQNADKALYLAKELGRNRVKVYAQNK